MNVNLLELPKTSIIKGIERGKCYLATIAGIVNYISPIGTRRIVSLAPIITLTTPLTGATINANVTQDDETHIITPAGTIAELAFNLPPVAKSHKGQIVRLQSTQIITALTIAQVGSGTISGAALSAAAVNVPYAFQCTSVTGAGIWHRIQ